MTERNIRPGGFRSWWPYPGIVFALLSMSFTLAGVTLWLATHDPSFGLEEDYYAKAVAWDETAQQSSVNEKLGWQAEVQFSTQVDGKGDRAVTVLLQDNEGSPIAGATVEVFCFHNARRSDTYAFTLVEIAQGRYAAGEQLLRQGIWTVRLRVSRGDDLFTTEVLEWTD